MKETNYSQILREFSEISIQIKLDQNQSKYVDLGYRDRFTDELYIPSYYDFWVKFQEEDFIFLNPPENFELSYSKRIDQIRDNYYQEIKDSVFNNEDSIRIIYLLADYKEKFQQIKKNYYLQSFYVNSITFKYLCNKSVPLNDLNGKIDSITLASILDKYYQIQLRSIDNILEHLEYRIKLFEKVQDINGVSIEKSEFKQEVRKKQLKKSFKLNVQEFDKHDSKTALLGQFKEALVRGAFIENIDTRNFIKVFSEGEITKQIVWTGKAKELAYLIRKLHGKKIIFPIKDYWIVTCNCFLSYQDRNKTKPSDPAYLGRITIPRKHVALDSALDIFNLA